MSVQENNRGVSTASPTSKRALLWILALTAGPLLVASLLFYFRWTPAQPHTVGQLMVQALPPAEVLDVANQRVVNWKESPRWRLLMVHNGPCEAQCLARLAWMRQVRLAQGNAQFRVDRVWLSSDAAPAAMPAEFAGTQQWQDRAQRWLPLFSSPQAAQEVHLLDPHGNWVMRYRLDQDHGKVIREISKLLKYNQRIG